MSEERHVRDRNWNEGSFWMDAIKSIGVPAAVLFYILISISPRLDRIIELQTEIATILKVKNQSSSAQRPVGVPSDTPTSAEAQK